MNDPRWSWCVDALMRQRGLSQDEARGIALDEVLDRGLASLEDELAGHDEADELDEDNLI